MEPNLIVFDRIESSIARAASRACVDVGLQSLSAEGGDLAPLLKQQDGLIRAVICDHPAYSEGDFDPKAPNLLDVDRICDLLRADLTHFLSVCRAATQSFMPHKQGAVWAIGIDDVAVDILGGFTAPAASQARIGALKSLAKEYGRMGLTYNALVCQPPKESLAENAWRMKREAFKVYALRYRARGADEYGRFLIQALESSKAMNGAIVSLGVGVMEMGA